MLLLRLVILIFRIAFGLISWTFGQVRSLPRHRLPVGETGQATVRVIDGDTVETSRAERLRLYGLDAPEHQTRAGRAAARRLRELLDTSDITYRIYGRDHYGRRLVVLYACGEDVNERMVEEGHATAHGRYTGRYRAADWRSRLGNSSDGVFPSPESVRHG